MFLSIKMMELESFLFFVCVTGSKNLSSGARTRLRLVASILYIECAHSCNVRANGLFKRCRCFKKQNKPGDGQSCVSCEGRRRVTALCQLSTVCIACK